MTCANGRCKNCKCQDAPQPQRCGTPMTAGSPGGTRYVYGCPNDAVDGGLCPQHAAEKQRQLDEFQRWMDNATYHSPSIKFHDKGQYCSCGAFINDGEEHPWNLNHNDEMVWWEAHPDAPHRNRVKEAFR